MDHTISEDHICMCKSSLLAQDVSVLVFSKLCKTDLSPSDAIKCP